MELFTEAMMEEENCCIDEINDVSLVIMVLLTGIAIKSLCLG